jgi:hypothetical protein
MKKELVIAGAFIAAVLVVYALQLIGVNVLPWIIAVLSVAFALFALQIVRQLLAMENTLSDIRDLLKDLLNKMERR